MTDTKELVERLERENANWTGQCPQIYLDTPQAITRLQAERDEAVEALEFIARVADTAHADPKLRADGARTFRRIIDKAESVTPSRLKGGKE